MPTGKVIGQIEVSVGDIDIIGVDGVVRKPEYDGFVHEGEQIVSSDPSALFQIKYLALPEATAYDGVFRVLADGSVVAGMDEMDSIAGDEDLSDVLEVADAKEEVLDALETAAVEEDMAEVETAGEDVFDLETAAGEEGVDGSSTYIPTDVVADSSVQDFGRGGNPGVPGLGGIVDDQIEDEVRNEAVANPDSATVDEDSSVVIDILANDTNTGGTIDSTTVVISSEPTNGSVVVNADGTVTYTPNENFNGNDSFSYTIDDNLGIVSDPANVNITINPVDDPTVVFGDTAVTDEDTAVNIDVLANDTDIDGPVASVASVSQGANGSVVINPDGTITYTPNENFNGNDNFTYTNSEGTVGSVDVVVNPVDDPTVVVGDAATTNEDTSVNIDVLANDTDIDGPVATVASVTNGSNGSVILNPDGTVTYIPNLNFNGNDSFTYTNSEGTIGTVNVTVNPVDDPTIVIGDSATTSEDTSIKIDVLANDTDIDGPVAPVASVTQGSNGSVILNLDGTVTYVPNSNFNGNDSFTYTNSEGTVGTVNVTVTPVNDPTVVLDDAAVTDEGIAVDINVLANDTDIDSAKSPVASVTDGSNGTVVNNGDGTVTYTPTGDFYGNDTFTYTNSEGTTGTVQVTVNPINDAPVLALDLSGSQSGTDFSTTYTEGTAVSIADTDSQITDVDDTHIESATVTLTNAQADDVLNTPPDGTLTFTTDTSVPGEITVTITGSDTLAAYEDAIEAITFNNTSEDPDTTDRIITVVVNDGDTDSNTATTTITVNSVNDAPNATADDIVDPVLESDTLDTSLPTVFSVLDNDTDAEGDPLSVSEFATTTTTGVKSADGVNSTATALGGTVVMNADGTFVYTAPVLTHDDSVDPSPVIEDSFYYKAYDGQDESGWTKVTVDVSDDVPTIDVTGAYGPIGAETYTGTLDISKGADIPVAITMMINSITVAGVSGENLSISSVTPGGGVDYAWEGSFDYDGDTYNFTLDLTGSEYTLSLINPGTVIISPEEFDSELSGSGPAGTYNISYEDVETGDIFTATLSPITAGTVIDLGYVEATAVGTSVNGSGDGLGIGNNLLQSYFDNGPDNQDPADDEYTTESFIYDPTDPASEVKIFFTGGGNNSFNGDDVIHITVNGTEGGQVQTITIDPSDASFDPITGYDFYAVSLPDGWSAIDTMQVTAGFTGTEETTVKVAFGFSTVGESVDLDFIMDFQATVTDNDLDSDVVDFMVVSGVEDGTSESDVITGTFNVDNDPLSDSILGGAEDDTIVYDSSDTSIDGGTGTDTLLVLDGTLDLSNVGSITDIETIKLGSDAKIIGDFTADDVIDITNDASGQLTIDSAVGNDNSISVDASTFTSVVSDANYTTYSDGSSSLMIDINIDIIEV